MNDIKKAIEYFEYKLQRNMSKSRREFYEIAVSAMKDLQQYRQIGTLEECWEARKKQIPIEVANIHTDGCYCPACGAENNCDQGNIGDKHCPKRGQAIYQSKAAAGGKV